MDLVYVLIALLAMLGAYYLFSRKSGASASASLPSRDKAAPSQRPDRPKSQRPKSERPKSERSGRAPKADDAADAEAAPRPSVPPPIATAPASPGRLVSEPPPPPVRSPKPSEAPKAMDSGPGALERLRKGLNRSRSSEGFFGRLRAIFAGKTELSPELLREMEEVLLTSDVGTETTQLLLDGVKEELQQGDSSDPELVWKALATQSRRVLEVGGRSGALDLRSRPTLILMVGVNGAGKTTTIGKLATKLHASGHKCVLAAGDTFRAAAVQQLIVWGERVGCEVVRGKDGADPGSVVFEAVKRAQETGADVVLADTAGRLHTKSNLMAEMKKIAKTAEKALPGAPHEILLVVDSTNGQNALAQAREFHEALPLTGIVLTKLDGTAKGGVVLGIAQTLKLPVRFIGLGERADDLHEFRPAEFVEALLGLEAGKAN